MNIKPTKILILVAALALLIGGGYFLLQKYGEPKLQLDSLESLDLADSPLKEFRTLDVDFRVPTDFIDFSEVLPEKFTSGLSPEIKEFAPDITEMMKTMAPAEWKPDETICAKFKSVPWCWLVPKYRDICYKCKKQ